MTYVPYTLRPSFPTLVKNWLWDHAELEEEELMYDVGSVSKLLEVARDPDVLADYFENDSDRERFVDAAEREPYWASIEQHATSHFGLNARVSLRSNLQPFYTRLVAERLRVMLCLRFIAPVQHALTHDLGAYLRRPVIEETELIEIHARVRVSHVAQLTKIDMLYTLAQTLQSAPQSKDSARAIKGSRGKDWQVEHNRRSRHIHRVLQSAQHHIDASLSHGWSRRMVELREKVETQREEIAVRLAMEEITTHTHSTRSRQVEPVSDRTDTSTIVVSAGSHQQMGRRRRPRRPPRVAYEKLMLSGTQLYSWGVGPLSNVLRNCSSLWHLDLSNNGLLPIHAQTISQAIAAKGALRSLILCHNSIGNSGARWLAELLGGRHNLLTHLDISANANLGSEGIKTIAEALQSGHGASYDLRFAHTWGSYGGGRRGGDGSGERRESLSSLRKERALTSLNIGYNKLGHAGGMVISGLLSTNSSLVSLSCRNCGLGERSFRHIADGLQGNATLSRLDIGCDDAVGGDEESAGMNAGGETSGRKNWRKVRRGSGSHHNLLQLGGDSPTAAHQAGHGTTTVATASTVKSSNTTNVGLARLCAATRRGGVVVRLDLSGLVCANGGAATEDLMSCLLLPNGLRQTLSQRAASPPPRNVKGTSVRSLTSLNMMGAGTLRCLGPSGAAALARALEHNTALQSLNIASNFIGLKSLTPSDDGRHSQLSRSTPHRSMGTGDSSDFDPSGFLALATMLLTNATLTSLSLCDNELCAMVDTESWQPVGGGRDGGGSSPDRVRSPSSPPTLPPLAGESDYSDYSAHRRLCYALKAQKHVLTHLDLSHNMIGRHRVKPHDTVTRTRRAVMIMRGGGGGNGVESLHGGNGSGSGGTCSPAHVNFDEDGPAALADALHHSTSIQTVVLVHTKIPVGEILRGIREYHKYSEDLDLASHELEFEDCVLITRLMQYTKSVKSLDLSHNMLGCASAKPIAAMINANGSSLEIVRLDDTLLATPLGLHPDGMFYTDDNVMDCLEALANAAYGIDDSLALDLANNHLPAAAIQQFIHIGESKPRLSFRL